MLTPAATEAERGRLAKREAQTDASAGVLQAAATADLTYRLA
jgi:hypothetical protein